MDRCPCCKGPMERIARTAFQRIIFSEAYICPGCGFGFGCYRQLLALFVNNFRFVFSRFSHCICCGSGKVARSYYADAFSKNPLGWIQRLVGAPMLECSSCGWGYFDWRSPRPRRTRAVPVTTDDTARDLAALGRATRELEPTAARDDGEPHADQLAHKAAPKPFS